MAGRSVAIQFPVAGVVRRLGLLATADGSGPFPTPWAMNTRLEDSLTNRLRGGSFVGQAASTVADPRYLDLVTENGDTIITENGDTIVFGPQYNVVGGDDREWASDGDDAPTAGTADCLYRARLLRVSGGIIHASRQGDTLDWDYGGESEDEGRATLFQLSEAGNIGDDVIALAPHKDAYLLCFTADETWVMHGDPVTGTLRNVSREVGIVGARAWCKVGDSVVFLSSHGLYSVGADGSGLKAVSEDVIPEDLTGVVDSACILDYHHATRGVSIHLTVSPSWFYDVARETFFPFDTSETGSHVLIGPIRVDEANKYGRLLQIHGTVAEGSADVTCRIVPGDSAEEAAANGKLAIEAALAGGDYSSYIHSSGVWSAGRNHVSYPRARAQWVCLWLSSAGTWAFESASMTVASSGRWR